MRVLLIVIACLFLIGCASVQKEEGAAESGSNLLFSLPEVGTGIIASDELVSAVLTAEVIEKDIPLVKTVTVDTYFGGDTIGVIVAKKWTSLFEIKTGIFVGWNIDYAVENDHRFKYGIAFTMTKF